MKVGECQGYIDEDCVNCGRRRVEHFSKGYDVCEKCRWCKQLNRYILDEEFYDDEENYNWLTELTEEHKAESEVQS